MLNVWHWIFFHVGQENQPGQKATCQRSIDFSKACSRLLFKIISLIREACSTAKTGSTHRMLVMDNEKTCRYENVKLNLNAQRKYLRRQGVNYYLLLSKEITNSL
jgi:hypothetical protein